jgi:hypothetical protein
LEEETAEGADRLAAEEVVLGGQEVTDEYLVGFLLVAVGQIRQKQVVVQVVQFVVFSFSLNSHLQILLFLLVLLLRSTLRIILKIHKALLLERVVEVVDGLLMLSELEVFDAQIAIVLHPVEYFQ